MRFIALALFFVVANFSILKAYADEVAPKFPKTEIFLGSVKMQVEVADNDKNREYGLMNRKTLPENSGMLFVFDTEEVLGFWMKNTLIPLSVGFFNNDGVLFDIQDMVPADPNDRKPKVYRSKGPAKFALEVNKGWFSKFGINRGFTLKIKKAKN